MKKNYAAPQCEVYRLAMKHRLCQGSLGIHEQQVSGTDAGWAKEDIFGESSNEPKPQSLWED